MNDTCKMSSVKIDALIHLVHGCIMWSNVAVEKAFITSEILCLSL